VVICCSLGHFFKRKVSKKKWGKRTKISIKYKNKMGLIVVKFHTKSFSIFGQVMPDRRRFISLIKLSWLFWISALKEKPTSMNIASVVLCINFTPCTHQVILFTAPQWRIEIMRRGLGGQTVVLSKRPVVNCVNSPGRWKKFMPRSM